MGTRIPYDSIHRLENQYGSLSLVPDDNKKLQKIQSYFIVPVLNSGEKSRQKKKRKLNTIKF